jgi:hypothetical protein
MRIFNLITSWLLWVLCACYALTVLAFLFLDKTSPPENTPPEKLVNFVRTFWLALVIFAACAAGAYFLRWRFWFAKNLRAGLGFWAVTVFFYFSVLFTTLAGFVPYFAGDRSIIQWVSCVLGIIFVVIGFPRVPNVSAPPTFPADQNPSAVNN